MTPSAFTAQFNIIVETLRLKEWDSLLSEWLNVGKPLHFGQRAKEISNLIHETELGFDKLKSDGETISILNGWAFPDLLSREFRDMMVAASLQHATAPQHINNVDVFRRISRVAAAINGFIKLSEILPAFLGHAKIPLREGSTTIPLWIIDDKECHVDSERVRNVLLAVQRLNKFLLQTFELSESALKVLYVESGTILSFVLEVAIPVSTFLIVAFNFYFENIQWMKFRKMKMGADALSSSFAVVRTIEELSKQGIIKEDRARLLESRITSSLDSLIMSGAFFQSEDRPPSTSAKLLLEQAEQLLLNPPVPESDEPSDEAMIEPSKL